MLNKPVPTVQSSRLPGSIHSQHLPYQTNLCIPKIFVPYPLVGLSKMLPGFIGQEVTTTVPDETLVPTTHTPPPSDNVSSSVATQPSAESETNIPQNKYLDTTTAQKQTIIIASMLGFVILATVLVCVILVTVRRRGRNKALAAHKAGVSDAVKELDDRTAA